MFPICIQDIFPNIVHWVVAFLSGQAFIEVCEEYALLLKGTSWGSDTSMEPPAVLTR